MVDEVNLVPPCPSISSCCPLSTQDAGGASKTEEDEEEVLDEETLRRDQVIKGAIDVLIREYASELNAPSQDSDSQPRNKKRKEKKEEVRQCHAAALPVAADLSVVPRCLVGSSFCSFSFRARRTSAPWRWRTTRET